MISIKLRYHFIFVFILSFLISGCGGSSADSRDSDIASNPGESTEVFENELGKIIATSLTSDGTKTTTVTDESGAHILTLTTTTEGVTVAYEGYEGSTNIEFSNKLQKLPSDLATNRLGAYIASFVRFDDDNSIVENGEVTTLDNPGCDWFPDTECTLRCCALHDQCFSANSCTAKSWLPGLDTDECKNCNSVAASCILNACSSVEDPEVGDRCFDNRCNAFFDCGGNNCDCASPCDETSPATCGNGSCEVGENTSNCYADCSEGAGVNQCCLQNNNCPSETPTDCPGSCCCCGLGEVCGEGNLCVRTASLSPSRFIIENLTENGVRSFSIINGIAVPVELETQMKGYLGDACNPKDLELTKYKLVTPE